MTPQSASTQLAPSAVQREQIVQRLCSHFAANHLTMEELETRIDRAYKAPSLAELDALVTGLPVLDGAPASTETGVAVVDVPARGVMWAVMSGHTRRGHWTLPRHLKIMALMGGIVLDLRDAVISAGESEIEINACMAGIEIIVPPEVHVQCEGSAFMGAFETHGSRYALPPSPDRPTVRLTGLAVMAGVEAKVRADSGPLDDE